MLPRIGVVDLLSLTRISLSPPSRIVPPSGMRTVLSARRRLISGSWIVTGDCALNAPIDAPSSVWKVAIGVMRSATVGRSSIVMYCRSLLTVGRTSSVRPSWMTPMTGSAMKEVCATSTSKSWMKLIWLTTVRFARCVL